MSGLLQLRATGLGAALALSCATLVYADTTNDYRRVYDETRLCFVANGNVYSAFKRAGDNANMKLFDKKAHESYDLARFNGNKLGLSQAQILADIQATSDRESPRLVSERGYLTTVAKSCKSWGLM